MRPISHTLVGIVALVLMVVTVNAAELNPAAVTFTLPDKINWKSLPDYGGSNLQIWSATRQSRASTYNSSSGCRAI